MAQTQRHANVLPFPAAAVYREPQPPAQANAVRVSPFRAGVVIGVGFTAFARPGAARSLTLFGPPVLEAVKRILTELNRAPQHVTAKAQAMGDVALLTALPGEPRWPLAFVYEGLDEAALTRGLTSLALDGWTPPPAAVRL